ncbi:unnamed protein product [Rhizopus stolonifer]
MSITRDPATLERDVSQIDQALAQVSNVRNSLKQFVQLIEQEQKGPNYVQAFSERINKFKQDLHQLGNESELLKGANIKTIVCIGIYTIKSNQEEFDWLKREKEENQKTIKKEIGSSVENKANYAYKQLSSVVFDQNPTSIESFFTTCTQDWIAHNKEQASRIKLSFKEQPVVSGTTCLLKVIVQKGFVAELELEYLTSSNTLVIHQHDIRGLKEDKHCWQDTQYLVFQKLNLLASVALKDMSAFFARESLFSILEWFSSYHDLFTATCNQCSHVLQFDTITAKYLPPIVRTWNTKHIQNKPVAYHRRCFNEHQNSQAIWQKYALIE